MALGFRPLKKLKNSAGTARAHLLGRDHLSQRHFIKYDGDGKIVHHVPARDVPPGRAVPAGFFSSQEEKNEKIARRASG